MRKIGLEERKKIQLDMMCMIDKYCRNNNINYTLYYGTLIGAIRHKGYIPWDDDIDIAMPRPDYMKFISGFNQYNKYYYVIAPEINLDFPPTYANVCDKRTILFEGGGKYRGIEMGIKIDVFPIDGIPNDENEYNLFRNRISELSDVIVVKKYNLPNIIHVRSFLYSLWRKLRYSYLSFRETQKSIINILKQYPYEESTIVDNVAYPVYRRERAPRKIFEEYIDVDFEGMKFRSVKEYDALLRQIYGDYMQLPPEEQRTQHHDVDCYWKD